MSDIVRLTFLSHAMTDAMAAGRFPADEPLNALGRRQCAEQTQTSPTRRDSWDLCVCSPEERTRQTAELLGLPVEVDDSLSDLDWGDWRGRASQGVGEHELLRFVTDPESAPHGGESIGRFVERTRAWLGEKSRRPCRLLTITHPAVIRAAILIALDAPPKSFWRIDIEPTSRTVMHFREQSWTLRSGSAQR